MWSSLQADVKKADKEEQKQMSKQNNSEDKKQSGAANMEVGVFQNLPQREQQILHNAAEELITQRFLGNNVQQQQNQLTIMQQQQQNHQTIVPHQQQNQQTLQQQQQNQQAVMQHQQQNQRLIPRGQPPQHQFLQPAVPPLPRHRQQVAATIGGQNLLQQQHKLIATVAPHQHKYPIYHQSQPQQSPEQVVPSGAATGGGQRHHQEDRMRGENPEAWLGGGRGIGGMVRQGILASSGEDVELGANVEVESSSVGEY